MLTINTEFSGRFLQCSYTSCSQFLQIWCSPGFLIKVRAVKAHVRQHCALATKKGTISWGALGKELPAGQGRLLLPLSALVRPHPECCAQSWAHHFKRWAAALGDPAWAGAWTKWPQRSLPTSTTLQLFCKSKSIQLRPCCKNLKLKRVSIYLKWFLSLLEIIGFCYWWLTPQWKLLISDILFPVFWPIIINPVTFLLYYCNFKNVFGPSLQCNFLK